QNRPADARRLLLDVKTKLPKNPAVAVKLAVNLMPDLPARARVEIDQFIKAAPRNPLGYVLLGEAQYRTGQFAEAEATLSKELAPSSRYPQVHFFLGKLAQQKGQTDKAIEHFENSLNIDRGYIPSRMALAEIFLKSDKLADAREEIRKTLEFDPG